MKEMPDADSYIKGLREEIKLLTSELNGFKTLATELTRENDKLKEKIKEQEMWMQKLPVELWSWRRKE